MEYHLDVCRHHLFGGGQTSQMQGQTPCRHQQACQRRLRFQHPVFELPLIQGKLPQGLILLQPHQDATFHCECRYASHPPSINKNLKADYIIFYRLCQNDYMYLMVGRVGVEPTSPVFQTGAVTTLATAPLMVLYLERETGFEPAASSLARRRSTAELFPQILGYYIKIYN